MVKVSPKQRKKSVNWWGVGIKLVAFALLLMAVALFIYLISALWPLVAVMLIFYGFLKAGKGWFASTMYPRD